MLNYQRVSPDIFFEGERRCSDWKSGVWHLSRGRFLCQGRHLGQFVFGNQEPWKHRKITKWINVNHTLINSPHIWTIWTAHGFDSWGFLFRGSIRLSPISCPWLHRFYSPTTSRQPPAMAAAECEARGPTRRFQYMWADAGICGFSRLAALNPARWRGWGGKEVEGTLW